MCGACCGHSPFFYAERVHAKCSVGEGSLQWEMGHPGGVLFSAKSLRTQPNVRPAALTYLITSALIRGFHPFYSGFALQNSDSATQYPQARPTRKVNSVATRPSSTQHGEHRSPRPAHASKGAQGESIHCLAHRAAQTRQHCNYPAKLAGPCP